MDSAVRSSSASALGKLAGRTAIPALIETIIDRDYTVRWSTIEALGMIGKAGDSQITAALMKTLSSDDNIGARRSAAEALGKIGIQLVSLR